MPFEPELLLSACAAHVADNPWVHFDPQAVAEAVPMLHRALLFLPPWSDPGMLEGSPAELVGWLVAYNAINYSYWPDHGPRWHSVVDGRPVGADDEALGIMVGFAEALRRGVPLLDADYLLAMDTATLDALLPTAPGAGALPLADQRVAALVELGGAWRALGGPAGLLERAQGSALRFIDTLVAACPSWDDRRRLGGVEVAFHKRLQLCAAMVQGALARAGTAPFSDAQRLTAFADYRLPQVLRDLGVLRLAPELAARIEAAELLPAGCAEELALRAATIHGAELLRQALLPRVPQATALAIDHLLWRSAVQHQKRLPGFHRTRCRDY